MGCRRLPHDLYLLKKISYINPRNGSNPNRCENAKGEVDDMRRSKTRPTSKAGLPPGSLVHIGSTKLAPVKIRYVVYDAERLQEAEGVLPKACQGADQAAGITWINLDGVHEAEQVAAVGQCLRLHPLTLEDIMNTAQRPKSEAQGVFLQR